MKPRVAVVGASGFIGTAVADRLSARGAEVVPVRAPRVYGTVGSEPPDAEAVASTAALLGDVTCVINAAGVPDALSGGNTTLDGANGLLPGLLARACRLRGVRLVHVSSGAVQGPHPLDSALTYAPFSPYSRSKVIGEQAVLAVGGNVCIFRPPGVHHPSRRVTRSLTALAHSPLSSVASPGSANAPQAQLINVADAIAFIALREAQLPQIVHMPSEGLSTSSLLAALGGRAPRRVPRTVASMTTRVVRAAGFLDQGLAGQARRLDVLWFGQAQAPSWLSAVGWTPPSGPEGWAHMSSVTKQEEHR